MLKEYIVIGAKINHYLSPKMAKCWHMNLQLLIPRMFPKYGPQILLLKKISYIILG